MMTNQMMTNQMMTNQMMCQVMKNHRKDRKQLKSEFIGTQLLYIGFNNVFNRFLVFLLPLFLNCVAMEPDELVGQTQSEVAAIANLLRDPFVQADLELSDDQIEAWRSEGLRINTGIMELLDLQNKIDFGKASDHEKQQVADGHKVLYDQALSKVESVFLPHQAKRFTQILWQMKTRPKGTSFGVLNLGDELSMTDEQKKTVRELVKVQDEEFEEFLEAQRKSMQEKRAELRKSLLEKLSAAQRSKFEDLVGEEFIHPLKSRVWFSPQPRDLEN